MSKVVIPISVELGNSLSQIKKVDQSFQDLAKNAAKPITGSVNDAPFNSIKQQLRQANTELQNAVANFGKLSPQAQEAAKRVADLRDVVEDAAKAAAAADFEDSFEVAGKAIAGVASAFQTATALQAVFGSESKATEEALKKVQAVMALTQGISGLLEGKKAFEALAASGTKAFAALKSAIGSFGIGALVVGLGAVVAYWDDIKTAIFGAKSAQEKLNEEVQKVSSESIQEFQKGFTDAKVKIDLVTVSIDQAKKGIISKESALQTYNETLGDSLGKVTNLDDAERTINANADTYIKVAGLKARANVFLAKSAEAAAKGTTADLEAAQELDAIIKAFGTGTTYLGVIDTEGIKDRLQKKTEAYKKDQKLAEDVFQNQANALLKEANLLEEGVKNTKRTNDKKTKEEEDAEAKRKQLRQKALDDIKKKQEDINNVGKNLQLKLQEIDLGIKFGDVQGTGLEQQLKAFQDSVKEYLKLGLTYDSNQVQELLTKIAETKLKLFKPVKIQSSFDLELEQLENVDKVKKDIEQKYNRFKELKPIQLKLVELSPEQQAAAQQIRDQAASAVDGFEESKEKILDIASTLQSGLSDAFAGFGEAIGKAIVEGGNIFEAIGNTLVSSLGDLLINIGKQIIAANVVIEKAKLAFGIPVLGVLTGIAVVALGNILKASIAKQTKKGFATGGFVYGPGTETSDSIPARLSKGEYVIKAKSVRKYGANTFNKLNAGQVPVASLVMATERSTGRNGERATALVNRYAGLEMFSEGGLVTSQSARDGGSSKALVNRFAYIDPFAQFGRNGERATALVNRSALPNIGGDNFQRGQPYIVTTKISGQDLKLVLERADRRFSNAT